MRRSLIDKAKEGKYQLTELEAVIEFWELRFKVNQVLSAIRNNLKVPEVNTLQEDVEFLVNFKEK